MLRNYHVTLRYTYGVIMLRKAKFSYGRIYTLTGLHKETIQQVLKRAEQNPNDPSATRP